MQAKGMRLLEEAAGAMMGRAADSPSAPALPEEREIALSVGLRP